MCASSSRATSNRTKRVSASTTARCWPIADRVRRYTHQQYLRTPAGDGARCSPMSPRHWPTPWRSRAAAAWPLKLGQVRLPHYPVPGGMTTDEFLRQEAGVAGSRCGSAELGAINAEVYRKRLQSELDVICQMGFAGYFLIVADFIRWAQRERRAGRPRSRLRRRLAGRLQSAHHRSRSAALRPAVRALPESRARLDAGLRRRFLHGGPRPRDRLRRRASTAANASRRSSRTAPWPQRPSCATSAACWA